jgi:hypothetical protein
MQLRSGYSFHGASIDMLTDADDLSLLSEIPKGPQTMLGTAGCVATWTGLKFIPRYCATLHIDGTRRGALPTQEGAPTTLSEMEVYEHLGVPTGYHVAQFADKALKYKLQAKNDK